MNGVAESGISWARIECEFAHVDDEALGGIATPLSGAWGIGDCGDGVVALTLRAEPASDEAASAETAAGNNPETSPACGEETDIHEPEPGRGETAVTAPVAGEDAGEPETGCVLRFVEHRFANLVASCSVKLGDGVAGLVYRASRKGDYLCVELDAAKGTVALVKVKAGRRMILSSEQQELPRGQWLHLYLRHVNPFHSLFINGELALTTEYRVPGGYLATGAVGVKGERPGDAHFARLGAVDVVAGD